MPSNRRIKFKTKKRFKKRWDRVVGGLGRRITIYLHPLEHECPSCYYDKVNRMSSNVCKVSPGNPGYFIGGRCPTCNGRGVLITLRKRCIDGIVVWNPGGDKMNEFTFSEAGHEGARQVEIKTDPCHKDLITNCDHAVVDGISCKLSDPPVIRGLGEKHLLIAHFFATEK
jgi:hypothetical protein